jgi:hypothetical protein
MCFQILGFDILIDRKFRPWLIEVNQSPSFETDSPLDYKVKKAVVQDAFFLLNASTERRKEFHQKNKKLMKQRILTGKVKKMEPEVRAALKEKKLKARFKFEEDRMGGYEMIYPSKNADMQEEYESFIKRANELWDEFTTGNKKNADRIREVRENAARNFAGVYKPAPPVKRVATHVTTTNLSTNQYKPPNNIVSRVNTNLARGST